MRTSALRGGPAAHAEPEVASARKPALSALPSVTDLYHAHFEFVWRTVRRLGTPPAHVDDVVQEVFVTVHRKIASFEGRSEPRTWLYGITRRVVSNHRRTLTRRAAYEQTAAELQELAPDRSQSEIEQLDGARLLHALLEELDEEKREIFVLYELEQLSGREIAEALQLSESCVYGRVRGARRAFEQALQRHRARQRRRS